MTNLTARDNAGYALLYWDSPSDSRSSVERYDIYRGTSSGNVYFLASTQFTNYTDSSVNKGAIYYYRVRAVNTYGNGNFSNEASVSILASSSNYSSISTNPSPTSSGAPLTIGAAYVNISPSIWGQTLSVSWEVSSHFQACRAWFGGSNETKINLPASGSVSFSISGVPAGTYGISVRCFRPNEIDWMSNYNDSAYQSIGMAATSSVSITAANQASTSASAFACGCVNGSATGTITKCSDVVNLQTFCMVQCTQQNKGYYDGSSFGCVDN